MSPAADTVVLVHGLWMPGWDLGLLARRLRAAGFLTQVFRYASVRRPPADNARALGDFVASLDARCLHLVGHSLGGLVIRHLFASGAAPRVPGRIVTLGTPHCGSLRARVVWDKPWGRALLGQAFDTALSGRLPPWEGARELGTIAGSLSLGASQVFGALPAPDDGVVSVEETRLEHACDHLVLRVSHTGLVLSPEVARQTVHFLRTGRFAHDAH